MESLLLIGAFLLAAVLCWFAVGRLGRFLDRGGVSPFWDEREERAAEQEREEPPRARRREQQDGCSIPDSRV